jgi:Colicin V production protein
MHAASGSPVWQTIFLSFACVLILFEVVRGWRLGLMRQVMRAGAVVAAYLCAIFGGRILLPLFRPFFKVPDIVISLVAGAILALVVYFVISIIGSILFKRTGQQGAGSVRLVYGISGAVAGIFFGLFTVWLVVIAIRSLGAVANAQLKVQASAQSNGGSQGRRFTTAQQRHDPPLTDSLAKLKNSIELGPLGEVVKRADVVPDATYETLGKVGQVVSSPQNAERFLSYPGAKELTENPKIVALRDDPEIMRMIQEGRLLDLLKDPRIIDAVNDPALGKQVRSFQFRQALDYSVNRR